MEVTFCLDVAIEIKKLVLILPSADFLLQIISWQSPRIEMLGRYWGRKARERPN